MRRGYCWTAARARQQVDQGDGRGNGEAGDIIPKKSAATAARDLDIARRRRIQARRSTGRIRTPSLSPLWVACKNGHVDVVRLLLDKGAEVDEARKDGATPLFIACQNGHVDAAWLLLERGAVVRARRAAVHLRRRHGRGKMADKAGAHYRAKTAATAAVRRKGDIAVARRRQDKGAEVDPQVEDGWTPLYIACKNGHVDVVRLLLDKGAEVHRACEDDKTPLYIRP